MQRFPKASALSATLPVLLVMEKDLLTALPASLHLLYPVQENVFYVTTLARPATEPQNSTVRLVKSLLS